MIVAAILGPAHRQVNATVPAIYVGVEVIQSGCAKMVPFRHRKSLGVRYSGDPAPNNSAILLVGPAEFLPKVGLLVENDKQMKD